VSINNVLIKIFPVNGLLVTVLNTLLECAVMTSSNHYVIKCSVSFLFPVVQKV